MTPGRATGRATVPKPGTPQPATSAGDSVNDTPHSPSNTPNADRYEEKQVTDQHIESRQPGNRTAPDTHHGDSTAATAAEQTRGGRKEEPMDEAAALRAEIEQTRTEMGETAAALVAKLDVPSRVKNAAADKKDQLTEAAADKKQHLTEVAAEKKTQLTEAAAEKTSHMTEAAGAIAAKAGEAVSSLTAKVKPAHHDETAAPAEIAAPTATGATGRDNLTAATAGPRTAPAGRHDTEQKQATAETRAHFAEAAAEAAERASTALGTLPSRASEAIGTIRDRASTTAGALPDRVSDQRQRYALIGAALAAAAAAAVLIRRRR